MLQSMGPQRVTYNSVTELEKTKHHFWNDNVYQLSE